MCMILDNILTSVSDTYDVTMKVIYALSILEIIQLKKRVLRIVQMLVSFDITMNPFVKVYLMLFPYSIQVF